MFNAIVKVASGLTAVCGLIVAGGNLLSSYRRAKEFKELHAGTERILTGGVWTDEEGNLYNCHGEKIGHAEWKEGYVV